MAVAAEMQYQPRLNTYRLIDAVPAVFSERQILRNRAQLLLADRKLLSADPAPAEVLLPVDALSTAHKVLVAAMTYGEDSPQHRQVDAGLALDCERLTGEWYRKKRPEYFEPIRHVLDADSQDFFSHGLSARQMTENALVPIPDDPEEEDRRINEYVEDATPQIVRRLGKIAVGDEAIRTISECTDKAEADYASDVWFGRKHRGYGGMVPEIKKMMIRDIRFETKSFDRFVEQIGLPGTYISHEILQETLRRRGIAEAAQLDKTQLHAAQMIVNDDLMDFAANLDSVASEQWCTNIFMGEVVGVDFVKDYAGFRREAFRRKEHLKDIANTVKVYVLDLAATNTDRRKAPIMVEEFVKKLLLKEAKQDLKVAEQMFDKPTLQGLQEVVYLESIGQSRLAFERMAAVEQAAPGGGYCSGGSCELESVDTSSATGRELANKVRAGPGDTVVKDKERSCRCGSKNIIYAYNKSKVNKYCDACGAFESKVSRAPA